MHQTLWAGIDLKLENASFHFESMAKALQSPEQTPVNVVLESSGALIGSDWHRPFYAHLDAFLSASRSVPELIRCCFGEDNFKVMKTWFAGLDREEQDRRREFQDQFRPDYDKFRNLPLGTARHISEHRSGFPPVTVTVSGRFGLSYRGDPINRIPMSQRPSIPPSPRYAFMAKSVPLRPSRQDFDIDGKPLFETCQDYLARAQALVTQARTLAEQVHGDRHLTPPPSDL